MVDNGEGHVSYNHSLQKSEFSTIMEKITNYGRK